MNKLLLSIALVLLCASTVSAGPFRLFRARSTQSPQHTAPYNRYQPYRSYFPRYTGGFHERYYQEIGIPTGDRPIRGTAW